MMADNLFTAPSNRKGQGGQADQASPGAKMSDARSKQALAMASGLAIALAYLLKKFRRRSAPLYVLKNNDLEVHVSAMGGIIQRLFAPDKDGVKADVVLGHDTLDEYLVSPHATCTQHRLLCCESRGDGVSYTLWK